MSFDAAVLQVVILRDGLLVGTEMFVPGSFTVGSSPEAEIRLDDPSVDALHAVLFFQNGRAAIQDNGSRGGLFVNGHRVRACEVRSQDEVLIGPFALKTRVMTKQSTAQKPAPSPEVAALLNGPTAPNHPRVAPVRPPEGNVVTAPAVRASARPIPLTAPVPQASPPPGTAISTRRAAALAAAPHLRPVEPLSEEEPTDSTAVPLGSGLDKTVITGSHPIPTDAELTAALAIPRAPAPAAPKIPASNGKGPARLYLELYWGEVRKDARSFKKLGAKKPLVAAPSEDAAMPLWGFTLPEERFVLAESARDTFRLFVPPGAVAEKLNGDAFFPVSPRELEAEGARRYLTLSKGAAARLSEGELSLVAYVAPPPEKVWANPFRGLPWLVLILFVLLMGGFVSFLVFGPQPRDLPDFRAKDLPAVAVRLMMPEPEKKKAAEKKLAQLKEKAERKKATPKADKKDKPKAETRTAAVKTPATQSKALAAIARLSAAGPATNDVLAAIDKMGTGGSKNTKKDFKLSGLVGNAPVANSGLGSIGLGNKGSSTKGLEMLNGRGGTIGALGSAGFGKGRAVGGTVTRATSRQVAAQGNIDREAVAKVINSHLQEVRGCYERALLRDPGLAGKAVLEWTISTAGAVVSVKTKSSTLKNSEVESCILKSIKTWRFPPARGGQVIISYPFVFNSVGY